MVVLAPVPAARCRFDQSWSGPCGVEVDQPGPRARGDGPGCGVDPHRGHRGDVDDQPGGGGPAGVAVAAAPGRDRKPVLADEGQAGGDVLRGTAVGDPGRPEAVEPGIEQPRILQVRGRPRPDERAGQVLSQRPPVGRGNGPGAAGRAGPAGRQGGQAGRRPGGPQERPAPGGQLAAGPDRLPWLRRRCHDLPSLRTSLPGTSPVVIGLDVVTTPLVGVTRS
jgi:hypothetical protein